MNKKWIIAIAAILILFVGGIYLLSSKGNGAESTKLDGFTQCLKDKGVVFYGAFWCPHCQNNKALFGASAKLLPYVECSTPDGQGQLDVCKDKGIESYPTWTFADDSKITGELGLERLAEKTSCELPK